MLTIVQADTQEQIQRFQELVAEYKAWDIEMSGRLGLNVDTLLDFGYKESVLELVAEFAPPSGRLLLASFDGQVAGCAGLRRLSLGIGEVKRVYVRPAFRRNGVWRALIEAGIAAARRIRYRRWRVGTGRCRVSRTGCG